MIYLCLLLFVPLYLLRIRFCKTRHGTFSLLRQLTTAIFSTVERIMPARIQSPHLCGIILLVSLIAVPTVPAAAQALYDMSGGMNRNYQSTVPETTPEAAELPARLRRQVVSYPSDEPPGTIIIDTAHTFLYLTLGGGKAIRYGIGVGRQGFIWSGVETIVRKAEWPDWTPPAAMIARQPYLPRWIGGGPGNPLGARALYLGNTEYRIHGTNDPTSIGKHMSSGCIRLLNQDVIDLYNRVGVGTKVVVLPNNRQHQASEKAGGEVLTAQMKVRHSDPPRRGDALSGIY
jgi:lipoprotein-anchoring transpeptidase ErfK/SrfK